MKFKAKTFKTGNSLAVIIPAHFYMGLNKERKLKRGDVVDVEIKSSDK